MKIIYALVTAVLFLAVYSSVQAEFGGGMGGPGAGMGSGMRGGARGGGIQQARSNPFADSSLLDIRELLSFEKELSLSNEQTDELKKLRSEALKNAAEEFKKADKPKSELSAVLSEDKPDFSLAKQKMNEIADISIQAQTVMVDYYEKAFNLLSDEQKQKLMRVKADIRRKKQQAMEGRGGEMDMPPGMR